jgi:hypothetical protein
MHRLLAGHFCRTAQQMGWDGLKNGVLLKSAEIDFELFITADQNIRYQQNLAGRKIVILELSTNKPQPNVNLMPIQIPQSAIRN